MSHTTRGRAPHLVRDVVRTAVAFVAYGLVAAVVAAPVSLERAVEGVRFEDRLGSLPVEVSLAHNGVSTLDTGILGSLYWDRTGTAGFGASIRATGPPEAGATLSSYVDPAFLRLSTQFVNDPEEVSRVYGATLRDQLLRRFLRHEGGAFVTGGALLTLVFRARAPFPSRPPGSRIVGVALAVAAATVASTATAAWLFDRWDGNAEIDQVHPMPGIEELSFSSPQTLEVARQVRPFVERNTERIRQRADAFIAAAEASSRVELAEHAAALRPRPGERIVVAEADPQGSLVGTAVRTRLYALLREDLGDDDLAMRTISGDVTSNGTVAEEGFVEEEADVIPTVATVAVKGDHDTATTLEQLADNDVVNPHFDVTEVAGLDVVGANDPAFKQLFGGLVVNTSGTSETELGSLLRQELDDADLDDPVIVLLHQPRSAAGYVGVDSVGDLDEAIGRESIPWDDGIPDLPPGIINVGHLHDAAPPRVIWNTDGDEITWTVLNQLGTSGGVEENPTFNRFSTPFSVPLKKMSMQLQYVDTGTGLQTGYASIEVATDGTVIVSERTDLGLPLSLR